MRFNPSDGLSVFQTNEMYILYNGRRGFNPSDGLSVFQTMRTSLAGRSRVLTFQSLGWVERLSDTPRRYAPDLAATGGFNPSDGLSVFQTILSSSPLPNSLSFNPSDGLSVFQTASMRRATLLGSLMFQSLGWVERLSDMEIHRVMCVAGFQPSDGLSVFQTYAGEAPDSEIRSFNPSDGLSVFQTNHRGFQTITGVSIPRMG